MKNETISNLITYTYLWIGTWKAKKP